MANIDNKKTIANVSKIVSQYSGNNNALIEKLQSLVKEGKRTEDLFLVGLAYYYLATIYYDTFNRNGILMASLKAVELLKDSEEYEYVAKAYIALGYAYAERVNYQMSLGCYDEAYKIIKAHRIKGDVRLTVLNDLSTCYHELGDVTKSTKILNECIRQLKLNEHFDYNDLAMYNLNLAENYRDVDNFNEAKKILLEMAEWLDCVSFKPMICDYYLRLAIIYYLLGENDCGNNWFDIAMPLIPKDIYPHPIYDDLNDLSHILVKNEDNIRSKKIVNIMNNYSKKNKGILEQIFAYSTMANYYRYFGSKEKAFECYEKLEELHNKRIQELERVQLDVHKRIKDANSEILKLKKKIQKNDLIHSLEPFTKLLNRSALLKLSSEFIEIALKKKSKVGAIFIDIDFFKECNDTYGHSIGDDIIKQVANICKEEENQNIKFARYGGDEFFGITKGLEDDELNEVAKRICRKTKEANIPNEKNPNGGIITLSVGVVNVSVTNQTDTIIEIANYADKAMYYTKNNGKNAIYMLKYDATKLNGQYSEYIKIDF